MSYRRIFLLLVIAGTYGCGKKAAGPPPRYAVIRFENLSGDPAVEWTGRAVSDMLAESLRGVLDGPMLASAAVARVGATLGLRPAAAPGISTEQTAARLAGATRVIAGYVENTPAGLRLTGTEEDITTGKMVRSVAAVDPNPLQAIMKLAREFSGRAGTAPTASEEALRSYSASRELPVEQARPGLEKAVAADPNFGAAWVALVQNSLARNDRQAAQAELAKARAQRLDKLSLANLDLDEATLAGDARARMAALKKISVYSPEDTVLLRSLAEAETASGHFTDAAADWKKLTEVLPDDPDAFNQLGYSRAWAGDFPGAVSAMKEYGRIRPSEANPIDSLGDVQYMNRKFGDASQSYLQAYAKVPAFLDGGDLYKAAWAKFMAGDKTGADASFAQFRKLREKSPTLAVIEADWLYRTGRQKDALAGLRKSLAAAATPAEKAPLSNLLAVLELLEGDREAGRRDAEAAGNPTTAAAFLVRFAALPSASADEWEARATKMLAAPQVAALRSLATGYALLLDGKKDAALPVWKQISDNAPATDLATRSAYLRLKGEQPPLLAPPDPTTVNEFAALFDRK